MVLRGVASCCQVVKSGPTALCILLFQPCSIVGLTQQTLPVYATSQVAKFCLAYSTIIQLPSKASLTREACSRLLLPGRLLKDSSQLAQSGPTLRLRLWTRAKSVSNSSAASALAVGDAALSFTTVSRDATSSTRYLRSREVLRRDSKGTCSTCRQKVQCEWLDKQYCRSYGGEDIATSCAVSLRTRTRGVSRHSPPAMIKTYVWSHSIVHPAHSPALRQASQGRS